MSASVVEQPRGLDWLVFAVVPLFFSSNLVFGRGIADEVSPFTTAFLRWGGSTLVVLPFLYRDWANVWSSLRRNTGLWLGLGFTNIVICGGIVYWSLRFTTASNATLIYTTSPLFTILFERLFLGRRIATREVIGMMLAFAGVVGIVLRGDFASVTQLSFNAGDLGIVVASMAFAAYTILLRDDCARSMPPLSLFALVAMTGTVLLLPVAGWEVLRGGLVPDTAPAWSKLAGLIVFASLGAFVGFQHAVRVFGASIAGTTMYLMSPASIMMAVIFLHESFEYYHALGIVLVLGGVMLATMRRMRRSSPA